MNKHLTFLSALALTTGLSLQAQNVNQMVIQANKIEQKFNRPCTAISSKTSTMEQTGTLCRINQEPFIRVPSKFYGMGHFWKCNSAK